MRIFLPQQKLFKQRRHTVSAAAVASIFCEASIVVGVRFRGEILGWVLETEAGQGGDCCRFLSCKASALLVKQFTASSQIFRGKA